MVERNAPVDMRLLRQGLVELGHRGPDAQQCVGINATAQTGDVIAGLGFGHARLAILDLDPRANQPFCRNGHMLAYNGEIYNFRDLGAEMALSTTSDTEVLLELLTVGGSDALAAANGMWAFCWFDPVRRRLTAARDRYGKKPLFYSVDAERICFASEPTALLAMTGAKPRARAGSLDSFVAEGWLLPGRDGATWLDGVQEVKPGHSLELDLAAWTLTERLVTPIDDGIHDDGTGPDRRDKDLSLADLVADAVEARLISDRKMALLLSGGVDSSLILSILAARGRLDDVVCVTGDAGKSDDAAYAQACLDQLGVKGLNLKLDYGDSGFDHFLDVCAAQGKPFPLIGNVLGMAALYQAASAEGVRVALDGTGADEIFGGYWYRQAGFAMRDAARANDQAWLGRVHAGGMLPGVLQGGGSLELLRDQLPTPERDLMGADDIALLRPEQRQCVISAPSSDPLVGFAGTFEAALALDARAGRMQEWLWQNDRNAMAASIENRSPFLDFRLARFIAGEGSDRFDGAANKQQLREMFSRFVTLPTAKRMGKQGFRWVYGKFLRQNSKAIRDVLHRSRIVTQYVTADTLSRLFSDPERLAGSRLIERLVVLAGLEARQRLFVD